MSSQIPAYTFSFLGAVFAFLTIFALLQGKIRANAEVVICRHADPLQFYASVICCGLLAAIFIFSGGYLFLHPGIIPVSDVGPD